MGNKINSFEVLEIWKLSLSLVLEIYKIVNHSRKMKVIFLQNRFKDQHIQFRQILPKEWDVFQNKNLSSF